MASIKAVLFNWVMKATFKSKPIHLMDPEVLRTRTDELAPKSRP